MKQINSETRQIRIERAIHPFKAFIGAITDEEPCEIRTIGNEIYSGKSWKSAYFYTVRANSFAGE